ncbi:hypothetical protein [Coxiella endosymbiont of Ornithodoros amblus]|uniref:hypothetical protein n=1 Tax=Coxiella endosymbiont of Ornithodoros amblus TaxID=1656166 RepID=UPI00244D9FF1|nr:hypothetical protein [Coxiella endosymbiont of Ornithodoros amblus]
MAAALTAEQLRKQPIKIGMALPPAFNIQGPLLEKERVFSFFVPAINFVEELR